MKAIHMKRKIKFKTTVHWLTYVLFLSLALSITSCEKEEEKIIFPKLTVVNQHDKNGIFISSVKLVGYEFNELHINNGASQTFNLDKGMPGGFSNINITITYTSPTRYISKEVNFINGETTTITLKGGSGAEGAPSTYVETDK